MTIHCRRTADLEPARLYDLLRLRQDVFVVEQECAYPDLDGRDLEDDAWHVWAEEDGRVVASLRLLRDSDGCGRIGRVATAADARGRGLSRRLMLAGLERLGDDHDVVLDAQVYLRGFYAGLGFVDDGPHFLEDGIPHVPMRRPATGTAGERALLEA